MTTLPMMVAACGGGGSGPRAPELDVASDAEWRSLATPRPTPLPGAARLAFAGMDLPRPGPWNAAYAVPTELGLSELVIAGLLRRRDVELVERRRFTAAVEAERAGGTRPAGAPAAGVSRGAELTATAAWLPLPGGQAALEIRLASTETGAIAGARRQLVPAQADPVGAARSIVATILATLDDLGRLPVWGDSVTVATPAEYRPSGIPRSSVERFMEGLAAEERWNWESARRSYQAASRSTGFFEADVALARTARLRAGGTLGES